jgi:hypothetical protein
MTDPGEVLAVIEPVLRVQAFPPLRIGRIRIKELFDRRGTRAQTDQTGRYRAGRK